MPGASPDVAYQYLAEIAEQRKDYQGALGWLDRIDDSRLETAVAVKRAQLLARMGKLDEADAVYADMIADTEDISDPVLRGQRLTAIRQAEIAMLLDAKAYDRARKALGERIAAEPDNADWIYELAMLDEREKRYDSMEKGLRKVIALQPDQKQGYNALGYSLADRNQRLPEALKLLEKASELGPDDPTSWIASAGSSSGWASSSPPRSCCAMPTPRRRKPRSARTSAKYCGSSASARKHDRCGPRRPRPSPTMKS